MSELVSAEGMGGGGGGDRRRRNKGVGSPVKQSPGGSAMQIGIVVPGNLVNVGQAVIVAPNVQAYAYATLVATSGYHVTVTPRGTIAGHPAFTVSVLSPG